MEKAVTPKKPSKGRQARLVQMRTVMLTREHTHMGTPWEPGAVLAMHPETASWLIARGVAQPSDLAEFTSKTAQSAP